MVSLGQWVAVSLATRSQPERSLCDLRRSMRSHKCFQAQDEAIQIAEVVGTAK